ncbi:MAG: thermonuclease family protein, partial [Actinomycetota bacterium]|nr:thermonuclease family protein [Actinomycetota bacterium]
AATSLLTRLEVRVRRRFSILVFVVLTFAILGAAGCGGSSRRPGGTGATTPAGKQPVEVVRVVDGDTIIVRVAGKNERVRLIGIDTPESVKPNTPVQCFALEASARTKALLPAGSSVKLVRDVDLRDRYGRLLAYVYRASDNLFVNLSLAADGYASAYTYPPNVAHAGELVAAAGEARDAGRGLWSRCRPP